MAEHKQLPPIVFIDIEGTIEHDKDQEDDLDHSKVAQWLAPAVFAANDGLVSTASLMLGMGAVSQDVNAMIVTGFLGLTAGACSMAIAEFISVDSTLNNETGQRDDEPRRDPIRAAIAAAFAFAVGALVPLTVALLLEGYNVTLGVVEGPISVVLAVFGWIGAFLDGAPGFRAALRVLLWGWVAMVVTFGLLINRNW
ncbi:vacuolar iron transporter homolog 4-like [Chenopodium quinoa]|uniref:vacuolar iron transporter homolog 4-like n=1 Tax=Chenopodium quinoa TaxID=63459 RepID=UPI000B78BB6F|nr:vacuolar iron transporter homolog 4-like [Chenopodium quinoa]